MLSQLLSVLSLCVLALVLELVSLQLKTVVSVSQKYEFFERAIRTDQPTADQRISQDEIAGCRLCWSLSIYIQ